MNNKPKILVASPTYDSMEYCVKDFLHSLKNIEYDNYDILLVDNSRDNNFFEKLKEEWDIILIKDTTNEIKNKLRLVSSRNKIIDYAIKNNYDYILMMDADVLPPKNIIKELLKNNKDIVSGLYYNYFIVDGKQKLNPVCWCEISDELFEKIKGKIKLPDFIKSKADMRRFLTKEEAESNECVKVMHPSPGCMLIKRKVFEKVRYGILDLPPQIRTSDDNYFVKKALEAGFELYCNTKIKCEHLIIGKLYKDKDGNLRNPLHD